MFVNLVVSIQAHWSNFVGVIATAFNVVTLARVADIHQGTTSEVQSLTTRQPSVTDGRTELRRGSMSGCSCAVIEILRRRRENCRRVAGRTQHTTRY